MAFLQGDLKSALFINPAGVVGLMLLLALSVWLPYDLITGKSTLFDVYRKTEAILRKRTVAIFLILLIVLNWLWNLQKPL